MGAAESRSHLEQSTSVPVLTINGDIEDETGLLQPALTLEPVSSCLALGASNPVRLLF